MIKQSRRWKRQTEQQFFETLTELLQNGYTLQRSLEVMQVIMTKQANDLKSIHTKLGQGEPLAICLQPFVRAHLRDELDLVSLHGCQIDLLRTIGEREKQYQQQFNQLGAILCYPALLLGLLALVGLYLGMYLMPQGNELEIQLIGGVIVGSVLVLGAYVIWFTKQSKLKQCQLLLRLPLLGNVVKMAIQQALYMQLGYLLQSGVSLQQVVRYCGTHPQHWICQLIGTSVQTAWETGQSLETGLNHVRYLSPEAKHLFMRGKPTQSIGQDLIQLAKYVNTRQKQQVQTVMASVQPICFVIIGICVIGLYMALLLPLYDQMIEMGDYY